MTEVSRFWNGTAVGDAAGQAPYDAPNEFSEAMGAYSASFGMPNNGGVARGVLSNFDASGAASPVTVGPGMCIVEGSWYKSDGNITVVVPNTISATRIDRIVLRKNWVAQTVRMFLISGTEGTGLPPGLTQVVGTTWEYSLYQVVVSNPSNAITLIDERNYLPGLLYGPFASGYGAAAVVSGLVLTHIKGPFHITLPPGGGRILVTAQQAWDFTNLGGPYFTEHSDNFIFVCYLDGAEEFRVENEVAQSVGSVRYTFHLNSILEAVSAGSHTVDFYATFTRDSGSTAVCINDARWARYSMLGIA